MDKKYSEKKVLRVRVDDDVWERIQFFKKELKKRGGSGSTGNVLRLLMIDAGWLPAKGWPHDVGKSVL